MACRFLDSFDHMATADEATKWTSIGVASLTIELGAGRTGNCIYISGAPYPYITIDNQATWIVGFAWKIPALVQGGILNFIDGGTQQCSLSLNTDGTINFVGGGGTALQTTVIGDAVVPNQWYHFQIKVTIGATGSYEFRINNVTKLQGSGVNTKATANSFAATIGFYGNLYNPSRFDDLYIFDGTGSLNNDFAGDCTVKAQFTSGLGAANSWTRAGGAASDWQSVNEATPDGDTTYLSSQTVGQITEFNYVDLTGNPTILAVQLNSTVRKDDTASHTVQNVCRASSTDVLDAAKSLNTSYFDVRSIWETNPDTSLPWTLAGLNGAQFGLKLAS